MATQETQVLDEILVNGRRKMMTLGVASLAGMFAAAAMPESAKAATTYTDNDILNFALNLEYLEANFYYLAAFGCTIDNPNAAASAAQVAAGGTSAAISITGGGVGTAGGRVNYAGVTGPVPFGSTTTGITVGSYATETAIEEGKHVVLLQSALGSLAVAQPYINLATISATQNGATVPGAWPTLATAAGVAGGAAFSPYTSAANFLIGAYVFEDVGVTAYHGAASLLTGTNTTLPVAAGILAVEAYHAGLVRTTINNLDPNNTSGYLTITQQISALRAALAKSALLGVTPGASSYDNTNDDYGLPTTSVSLAGGAAVTATHILDADLTSTDPINSICFARNTTQVLNIVTGGGAVNTSVTPNTVISPAKGVFFPAGLNGLFK
jgi:hypothetical protein